MVNKATKINDRIILTNAIANAITYKVNKIIDIT